MDAKKQVWISRLKSKRKKVKKGVVIEKERPSEQ